MKVAWLHISELGAFEHRIPTVIARVLPPVAISPI